MKLARHFASREILRVVFVGLAIVLVHACPLVAQPASSVSPQAALTPADLHSVVNIDGPWKFQIGDDPRWADPAFDDANWPTVTLSQPIAQQGYPTYTGYAWYRIHLGAQQLTQFIPEGPSDPSELLVTGDSIGQLAIYEDGVELGHTYGMTDSPQMYLAQPVIVQFSPPGPAGSRVLAIRTWAGPNVSIGQGLLSKVELGPRNEIANRAAAAQSSQWNENAAAAVGLAFVFLGVALLGGTLYLAQRHHAEYLWLAILCATAAVNRLERAAYSLAFMPLSVYWTLSEFRGYVFLAVTIEFVYRFTGGDMRRTVRTVQIAGLAAPFVHFLGISWLDNVVSTAAEAAFVTVSTLMLFRAWRRGRGDAGVMLVPFFLGAVSDWITGVLGVFANIHWLPQQFASPAFHIGPIKFTIGNITDGVFLGSLFAVILYRFIRVSEEEQRSSAEISAARSVQALLIPTQLPSNKNFMLESAYIPVNGVGGDFFQVLPLKDDSLLIVVGDVSGKGLQAAMNSSTLVGALRNELSYDPATVLEHLNHVLLGAVASPGAVPGLDSAPCFATCLCARIYPDGAMSIANAGHLSPYRDGRELELPPGLPLGVIADSQYEQAEFQLKRGDRLVFLSDGVVEATNAEGELFGFERTQQVSNEPARYIAQTAQRFGQTDDITVVSLYVASRAAERTSEKAAHTT
jgi:hypothetical protein